MTPPPSRRAGRPLSSTGGTTITGYEVSYRRLTGTNTYGSFEWSAWKTWPDFISGTSMTLTGLQTDTTYSVRARAVNADGAGDWSQRWRFTTGKTDPVLCKYIDLLTPH